MRELKVVENSRSCGASAGILGRNERMALLKAGRVAMVMAVDRRRGRSWKRCGSDVLVVAITASEWSVKEKDHAISSPEFAIERWY